LAPALLDGHSTPTNTTSEPKDSAMTPRQTALLRLQDLLAHLGTCQQQLSWAEEPETIHLTTETMLRDLEQCRRLCEELSRKNRLRRAM